jgi:hypothetical protein
MPHVLHAPLPFVSLWAAIIRNLFPLTVPRATSNCEPGFQGSYLGPCELTAMQGQPGLLLLSVYTALLGEAIWGLYNAFAV